MSNENHETIADIVKEMRTLGRLDEKSTDKIPRTLQAPGLRTYADRIEAAAKREREAGAEAAQVCGEIGEMIGREATREKSSQVGNAQEMRDALVAMVEAETGGTMERDYLCGRCLERLFDRCKHDGSCWVDKVMNALAEAKGEAK